MNWSFKQLGFKSGDKVRCLYSDDAELYDAGDEFILVESLIGEPVISKDGNYLNGAAGAWEMVKTIEKGSMFTETRIRTTVKDFKGCNSKFGNAYVEIKPYAFNMVFLKVSHDTPSPFSKVTLQNLIDELQKVANALEG